MDDPPKGIIGVLASKQGGRAVVTGLLLAIFMLGMVLRLYELDGDSMWLDEIITAQCAQPDLLSVVTHAGCNAHHPPLVDLVTWFFVTLSGNSDFVLRAQAMLFGSVSILLIYRVGEILWTRKEGIVAAFLLAVNAYHIRYSQEARSYALMVFLALLSLIFLLKALQKNKKRLWLGFILCTSLSLYNHYFAFLFLPAEVVFAASVIAQNRLSCRGKNGRASEGHASCGLSVPASQAVMFCLSLAVVGLSYLPWLPALQTHIAFLRGSQGGTLGTAGSLESTLSFLHTVLTNYSGMSGIALLLWVGMFVLGLAASDLKWIALVASWVGTPLVFLTFVQSPVRAKPRYLLFILPVCLLVIARAIASGARSLGPHGPGAKGVREWVLLIMAALAVLIVASLSVAPLRDYYLWEKVDWRGAAHYLAKNMEPGDILIADGKLYGGGGDSGPVSRCLSYYMASDGLADARILRVKRTLWGELQSLGEGDREVWAVLLYRNRPARWERTEEITLVDFPSLAIIRLRQPSGHLPEDSVTMLHVLLDLLGGAEGSFDVHLALAEIYLETGSHEQAGSHIVAANLVVPDDELAVVDLADASTRLQSFLHVELEDIRLGDVLSLPGYSMHPRSVAAGDAVHTTLSWQAVGNMDRDYTVFIHVVDQDDHIWAQEDKLLQHGDRRTSTWVEGEIAWEEYELRLPPDTPPGEYVVKVGVYYWVTGERLPVRDEGGERAAGDAILLGTITVTE